jgi:hypothetical protein
VFVLACMVAALVKPDAVLFPLGLAYMAFGITRGALLGLMERNEHEVPAVADDGEAVTSLTRERLGRRKEME